MVADGQLHDPLLLAAAPPSLVVARLDVEAAAVGADPRRSPRPRGRLRRSIRRRRSCPPQLPQLKSSVTAARPPNVPVPSVRFARLAAAAGGEARARRRSARRRPPRPPAPRRSCPRTANGVRDSTIDRPIAIRISGHSRHAPASCPVDVALLGGERDGPGGDQRQPPEEEPAVEVHDAILSCHQAQGMEGTFRPPIPVAHRGYPHLPNEGIGAQPGSGTIGSCHLGMAGVALWAPDQPRVLHSPNMPATPQRYHPFSLASHRIYYPNGNSGLTSREAGP